MSSYCINPYMDAFYTSRAFQGYQEHQNWSLNKEVMQVPKLEENQQTLQHLQQERLLYFEVFRYHMSSYYINPIWMDSTLQDHSNVTKNTQIAVCMTKLWPYEVGAKTGDCSNVATLRTNVATLQKQSIPTSRRCCTTSRRSGSVLGGFLAHLEPIMEVF